MIINGVELLYREKGSGGPFMPTPDYMIHNDHAAEPGWLEGYMSSNKRLYDFRWECPLYTIAREEESDEQAG